jgi:hypothetical protein
VEEEVMVVEEVVKAEGMEAQVEEVGEGRVGGEEDQVVLAAMVGEEGEVVKGSEVGGEA